jgi:hypothetical protein
VWVVCKRSILQFTLVAIIDAVFENGELFRNFVGVFQSEIETNPQTRSSCKCDRKIEEDRANGEM